MKKKIVLKIGYSVMSVGRRPIEVAQGEKSVGVLLPSTFGQLISAGDENASKYESAADQKH